MTQNYFLNKQKNYFFRKYSYKFNNNRRLNESLDLFKQAFLF